MNIKKIPDRKILERKARILRAIFHPFRIDLLDLLQETKGLTVIETSHYLEILRDKVVLKTERNGKYPYEL